MFTRFTFVLVFNTGLTSRITGFAVDTMCKYNDYQSILTRTSSIWVRKGVVCTFTSGSSTFLTTIWTGDTVSICCLIEIRFTDTFIVRDNSVVDTTVALFQAGSYDTALLAFGIDSSTRCINARAVKINVRMLTCACLICCSYYSSKFSFIRTTFAIDR